MAGLLPPDHIEHYKRQVDIKTDNLRFETTNFIKNFYLVHKHLPCFPWTFYQTLKTLRLFCDTIGHQNAILDNLPLIVENDLLKAIGNIFPPGFVPKYGKTTSDIIGGMFPCNTNNERLEKETSTFYLQMSTYIRCHFILYRKLPMIPHSFIVCFNYLKLKKIQTNDACEVEVVPNKLHQEVVAEFGNVPIGYIPFSTIR